MRDVNKSANKQCRVNLNSPKIGKLNQKFGTKFTLLMASSCIGWFEYRSVRMIRSGVKLSKYWFGCFVDYIYAYISL